jgi:hypothetical protein
LEIEQEWDSIRRGGRYQCIPRVDELETASIQDQTFSATRLYFLEPKKYADYNWTKAIQYSRDNAAHRLRFCKFVSREVDDAESECHLIARVSHNAAIHSFGFAGRSDRIQNRKGRIENRKSRIQNRKDRFENRKDRIEGRKDFDDRFVVWRSVPGQADGIGGNLRLEQIDSGK